MKQRTILISGASIAGPALAFWLRKYGWRTTLVERAEALRLGGQNVDVRGAGRQAAQRMGIEDDIRAATTGEVGTRFIDPRGRTSGEFPAGANGLTAELEILRGSLAEILYEKTREHSEYIFGDSIQGLRQDGERVTASFVKGSPRDFDVVVIADGMRSRTRALAFGDEAELRELGLYMAYGTIPRIASDDAWWRWYVLPRARSISLRPDNEGTTRAMLSFMGEPRGFERLDLAGQKAVLRRVFADAGGQAPRVLAAFDEANDLYFEAIGQVRAPRWSSGRIGLVGDAAYCASPISGMGTSLALTGAYVLAGELARHDDHVEGFAAYEKVMRPYVDQAQRLPPGAPRLAHPRSRVGVALFHAAVGVAARVARSGLASKLSSSSSRDDFVLPDYTALER